MPALPLTDFQREIFAVIAPTRTPDSYLAGGVAPNLAPNSLRYSHGLDFFHDSAERVAAAFAADAASLEEAGYGLEVSLSQPGFIRALVRKDVQATQIDWAHDSAWRFMPPVRDALGGYLLHPVDLAINKVLALAGREEARDLLDVLYVHERVLPLGALVWAAVGKDPGFTPLSLLEQLKRRGRFRPEEMARLDLATPFDPVEGKNRWLAALSEAERFAESRNPQEVGCLYYSDRSGQFEAPQPELSLADQGLELHFGRPGGVLPRPASQGMPDAGA